MAICLHINSRYVSSDTYDLDAYDRYTLERTIMACAEQINFKVQRGDTEAANSYAEFKSRIKTHLYGR